MIWLEETQEEIKFMQFASKFQIILRFLKIHLLKYGGSPAVLIFLINEEKNTC